MEECADADGTDDEAAADQIWTTCVIVWQLSGLGL
jgi:hypothetical protein